jgi:hypothetical protein
VIFSRKALFLCGALVIFGGCSDQPKKTPTEGAFGQIDAQPSTNIARPAPPPALALDGTPVLTVLQTELSPAILFQTDERELSFFGDMERSGRAAPSYAAFSTRGGPRPFKTGEQLAPAGMEENWVMVWFAGARGWTNGDVPWVVYLQHRPRSMQLDTNGLHFAFDNRAGSIALLPLYGSYVCPANENKSAVKFGGKPVQTWKWGEVLHREPLMRVRYWASALRWFPQDCEEMFSVDRSTDTLTLRQKISYVSIEDAWTTKRLKLNSVSPTLALASRDANFPVIFSRRVMDLEMPTAAGPYMAVEGDAPLEASFHVLHHINEGAPTSMTNLTAMTERGSWSRWSPPAQRGNECIAIAHNTYRAGRIDDYNYACYLFTRAITHRYFTNHLAAYTRTFSAQEVAPQPMPAAPAQPRLIPSGPPSPFVAGIEREAGQPDEPLAAHLVPVEGEWPQLALRGTELRFGSVKVGNSAPKKTTRLRHSPTSERIVVLR